MLFCKYIPRCSSALAPLLLTIALCLAPSVSCATDVLQGKCTSIDLDKKLIVIHEFDTNFDSRHRYGLETDTLVEFDISDAQIGIQPEVGDILRILYEMEEKKHKALRLMNVSKQDGLNN